jgi:ASC-1-like (ASCH) protein
MDGRGNILRLLAGPKRLNFVAVAIPLNPSRTMNVQALSPEYKIIDLTAIPVLNDADYEIEVFDERTILFFDALSKKIMSDASVNRLPEMVALAFWIRKTNLNKIKEDNIILFTQPNIISSPLGKVFHICPANVDTMFIYSLTVSALMGNRNILRISERMDAPQIRVLFQLVNELLTLPEFELFKSYISFISYSHDDAISTYISQKSNARIIWGGDNTIQTFRNFKPAPRTRDIIFADRVSIAVINCHAFNSLDENSKLELAEKFFNDAYTFDQKGCSSPQTVCFIGDKTDADKCLLQLTKLLSDVSKKRYQTDISSLASLKLNQMVDDTLSNLIVQKAGDNYTTFAITDERYNAMNLHSCGGGYFYAKRLSDIAELKKEISLKMQTIAYFGLDKRQLDALKEMAQGEGIDRIVPIGNALDFHYIWDGYNLLESLSRKVFVK